MKKLILLTFILLVSCESSTPPKQAFYFWRNHLELSTQEKKFVKLSTSPYLYTRFLDVDKVNNQYVPIGIGDTPSNFDTSKKIVPVVYIVNRVWQNIRPDEIEFLVDKIISSIKIKAERHKLTLSQEIQIDSDWTRTTQKDYFLFLSRLREQSGINISCTIRLHQIKDRDKTGIPPVDKGYLMCYATSSPLDDNGVNSILDVDLLKSYLSNLDSYPLNLDMAFPIYSWGIVTNHLGKKQLLNAITTKQLQSSPNFSAINDHTYKVDKDGFYFGLYMNQGFTIKVEEVSEKTIQESIQYINQHWTRPYQLIWYHLDERFLNNYPKLLL